VEAAKFPPLGNRGLDGAGLDGDYGLQAWGENSPYMTDANNETFIVAQIEIPEAVSKVDEVAAVPGIDALFVGSGDLGFRLAVSPKLDIKNLDSAIVLLCYKT
jgi:2-keto-3-deoxy-L-rhamnonate aldolase RhmA